MKRVSNDNRSRGVRTDVGYRRPPAEHRFQKGRSGNPNGRPRKPRDNASHANTQLDDILLAEALRPIQLRENDEIVVMPMIQAVIRAMGVAAVKGSHKSQTTLAAMVQAVETKRLEELTALFTSAIEYKERWKAEFERCDRLGVARPDPVPHPDDIVLESNTMKVRFNGPVSDDDKAHWDMMLARRQEALNEVAYCRQSLKKRSKYRDFYEDDMRHEQYLADMIGGIIPDEETRRRPGFDLQKWRDEKGVLAELAKKHRKRARRNRALALPSHPRETA